MIREFMLPTKMQTYPESFFIDHLKARGFSDDQVGNILTKSHIHIKHDDTVLKPHALGILSELYSNNWASTEGLNGTFNICTGSLAGTSCADLVFALAVSEIFDEIRHALLQEGLLTELDPSRGSVYVWP